MTVFGKSLSAYVRFQRVILGLILAAGVLRLALSMAGVPDESTRWLSMTAVAAAGIVYYGVRVHTSGFGSYRHLLPLMFIQGVLVHGLAVVAILISVATGQRTVFTAPEYAGPLGPGASAAAHAASHVLAGLTVFPLVTWALGAAVMFVTKKVTGRPAAARAA